MQIISNNEEIRDKLISLIQECKHMEIAIAWARTGNKVFDTLIENKEKIKRLLVGTHFYQTDPKFLEAFLEFEKAKVRLPEGPVFHPKIYYFALEDGGWECLIGSANLTNAAMYNNDEMMVLVSDSDAESSSAQMDVWKSMQQWEMNTIEINQDFIDTYLKHYESKQQYWQNINTPLPKKDNGSSFDSEIFSLSWAEYFNEVKYSGSNETDVITLGNSVLNTARELFDKNEHFSNFNNIDRKKVAGFYEKVENDIDWRWFGSMKGCGDFKKQINENNSHLSTALDCIPLNGIVTKQNYTAFIEEFLKAFPNGKNPLATSTRLISMKRPDYFICIDSQNKKQFCEDFGITISHLTIHTYWDLVVSKIINCLWWVKPSTKLHVSEQSVWNSRAAYLDVLYYKNLIRSNAKPYLMAQFPELLQYKLSSSRRWEQEDGFLGNWWFKFSKDDLKHEYIVIAGAMDNVNEDFKIFKVPSQYLRDNLDKLDNNADGLMINIYLAFDEHIDLRNENHLSFKKFSIN